MSVKIFSQRSRRYASRNYSNLCYRNLSEQGPKPNANLTEVVNIIFYILYSGFRWCSLPHDLLPRQTVSTKFPKWQRHGVWEKINHTLW
ncbi:MAG: transposase [Trichodesmium sp. MAG_R01]|nr:transposase [Trichodesmium sp. MAG_R01]